MSNHYDLIIVGSGAGGGTLFSALAPTGKRILLLERGGYVPREKANWSTRTRISSPTTRGRRPSITSTANEVKTQPIRQLVRRIPIRR